MKIIMFSKSTSKRRFVSSPVIALTLSCIVVSLQIISPFQQVLGFHLSFNHRLLKSVTNPQLNPANTLIRPVECRNANNQSEAGICMFAIDCMQNKGVPLSVCKHNYFVGTCCRLPDYNNFVGIVYDLRDTETNHLVEARGALPPSGDSGALHSKSDIGSTKASSQIASASGVSAQQIAATTTSNTQINSQEVPTTTTTTSQSGSSKAPTLTTGKAGSSGERFDEKYIISSTNLFPSTVIPSLTSQAENLMAPNYSNQQQQQVVKEALKVAPSSNSGESARNADGGLPSSFIISSLATSHLNKQQIVVPSDLDSFQIQTAQTATLGAANQSQYLRDSVYQTSGGSIKNKAGEQSAYELSKDSDSLEILSTITSVHSAPSTQQQFNIEHNALQQDTKAESALKPRPNGAPQADKLQVRLQQQQQNSIYSLIDNNQLQAKNSAPQQSIVFANNHQHQSSTLRPPPQQQQQQQSSLDYSTLANKASSQQPIGDQEFTLSSVSSSGQEELPSKASTVWLSSPVASSSFASTSAADSFERTPVAGNSSKVASSPQAPSNSWSQTPLVDLVSLGSFNSLAQATTPFTTSLSTALLPNVSSHPYSPTTSAPLASLVPSLVSTQFSSNNTTVTSGSTTTTASTSATSASSSSSSSSTTLADQRPALANESSTQSAPMAFSQLYSSQHGSGVTSGSSNKNKPLYVQLDTSNHQAPPALHANRPNSAGSALQAATKIVTSSSSTNHLLPGLSNLQSAILSNIPYKLATHLSSGLSSYFQTAMKPAGSRPLLSSNTAPSLQYQQQQQQLQLQLQANASKTAQAANAALSPQPPASVVKFPSSSSFLPPVDSSGASSSEPAEKATTWSSSAAWQFGSSSSGSTSPAPAIVHDIVREAQQICGRPQVSQVQSGALIGEGGKKRVARIVGGNQSSFGQWPWMVSLRQWRKGAFLHKCGAALLNENWAITAAHCVENVKVTDLLLRLGEFDVSNQEEPFPFAERRVKSVVSHPSFDPKTFEYDLALLRFSEPIKYERNIIPVCVPSGNDSYVDRMATVIGWGRLYEDGPLPDVIQHVDVPIITNNECEKMYKNAGFIEEIPEMFICAGISKGGRDSCEGDSGGPLTMIDHDGRSYLVGIISWGIGCALPSQPGVYTRITAFSGWINQIASN